MDANFRQSLRLWDFLRILNMDRQKSCFMFACEKKQKKSQYKGVSWHKMTEKWYVLIHLKGGEKKYGGVFKDELDAANRVNQLCDESGIPAKNPEISTIPNQQYQVTKKFILSQLFCYYKV